MIKTIKVVDENHLQQLLTELVTEELAAQYLSCDIVSAGKYIQEAIGFCYLHLPDGRILPAAPLDEVRLARAEDMAAFAKRRAEIPAFDSIVSAASNRHGR